MAFASCVAASRHVCFAGGRADVHEMFYLKRDLSFQNYSVLCRSHAVGNRQEGTVGAEQTRSRDAGAAEWPGRHQ